jgi:hypothetical protein
MGNPIHVALHKSILPVEYKNLEGWQTKSQLVDEHILDVLYIDEDGALHHKYWDSEKLPGEERAEIFPYVDKLTFTGELLFYAENGADILKMYWR